MSTKQSTALNRRSPASGCSTVGVTNPKGVCIVCGSGLLIQYWRGHVENQRIHCNDCGSEVTPLMHAKKQSNVPDQRPALAGKEKHE